MTISIDAELSQIGAALAAAGDGQPIELTDKQLEALVAARTEDVLDAIMEASRGKTQLTERYLTSIATAWSNELRTAFGDESTLLALSDALNSDDPQQRIVDLASSDTRLTNEERKELQRALSAVKVGPGEARQVEINYSPAYIKSISAEGFRGIGPHAELTIADGPGLTVVYGANGSGKSSFVEALDVLLTGGTGRFDGRGPEWRSAWANIHESTGGNIQATFTFATAAGESASVALKRSWTGNRFMAAAYDESPSRLMAHLGWLTALDEFKPVLGYEELGPLFEEDIIIQNNDEKVPKRPARTTRRTETSLARHIRLRAGVSDRLIEHLWTATHERRKEQLEMQEPFSAELHVLRRWHELDKKLLPSKKNRTNSRKNWMKVRSALISPTGTLMTPGQWRWDRIASIEKSSDKKSNYILAVLDFAKSAASAGLYAKGGTDTTGPSWRTTQVYCEMLVDAIYKIRLSPFSQHVADIWSTIRHDSAVSFDGLTLQQAVDHDNKLTLRASLGLTVDGVEGVERGVLSQGELHTLALSVFLPTMMRQDSPFRFAVIDDPVQVMDEHAVDGLAEVLRAAAEDLQVIVFTHDKRLLEALYWQGIKHTQINVTRTGKSVVKCEPVSDPVSQRIADARMLAEEAVANDEFRHRRNAAYQCRRAIEAACLRAVRAKFTRQGLSHQQIESKVEVALRNKDTTTLRLLALAIFGDVGGQRNVRRRMKDNPDEWGEQQEIDTLAQINALVHAVNLEAAVQSIVQAGRDRRRRGRASDAERAEREAREALGSDPRVLVDEVERLVKAIERNCA